MAEARRMAVLPHPNLVQLFGVRLNPTRRRFELVMERMHCSLAEAHADAVLDLHRNDSPLHAAAKAVQVLLQVSGASHMQSSCHAASNKLHKQAKFWLLGD